MISKKILYSEQLLQLVLALSLLQVDPVNYLEWGISRIHASDGSPWQLEVSHQPFSEYPYMGRKHYAPFIEDLTRFDNRFRGHDLQAYLLNLSDDHPPSPNNISNNSTANDQSNNGNSTDSHITPALNLMQQLNESSIDELFLHSDSHHALSSDIIEQNIADLNDYGETLEAASPLRETKLGLLDDPWDEFIRLQDVEILEENQRVQDFGTYSSSFSWDYAFDSNNDSAIANKSLHEDDETSTQKEEQTKENTEKSDDVNELSNISSVELTAEEMDLIEVLWKQDVDLGFNPLPANNPSLLPAQKEKKAEDDVEKLKALLDLKTDEKTSKDGSSNPWAGLHYTVDTETGEYILSSAQSSSEGELDDILLKEALKFVTDSETKDIESDLKPEESKEETTSKKSADNSAEDTEDLEAVLCSNLELDGGLQNDDLDFVLNSSLFDETEELNFDMMIQSSASHFQHPRQPPQNYPHCVNGYRQNNYQGRVPLARSTTMEQRWQDLANLLSFPPAMGMTDMSAHSAAAHYPPHYYQASSLNHSHPAVLHNASLAEIVSQSQPSTSHHLQPYTSSNLGSAVATSMHLTNSTSETDAGNSAYKMDHDMMYYSQANATELNHTSDGFLNMLKDEDLQLMDMAMNEGLYTMGMLDQNGTASGASNPHITTAGLMGSHLSHPGNLSSGLGTMNSTNASGSDRLDASSDSAVSSMGSERVASLSDGEWNEAGSDSAQEYNVRKFIGPYDYRFGGARMIDSNRHPVAQKKHQMYGKRFAHDSNILPPPPPAMHHPHPSLAPVEAVPNVPMKFEPYDNFTGVDAAVASSSSQAAVASAKASTSSESELKYSYTLDYHHRHMKSGSGISSHELVNHNHTYTMPPHGPQLLNNNGANPRPQTRDKKSKKAEDEHITRDEKRARALQIPIPVYDIINLPMDEFNERLSKYDLSENQLSLIRDIRRRGKNKVAAQNCRKRKLDQIITLADEVKDMKMRKDRFLREHEMLMTERRRIKDKFSALYRHVFTNLRDPEGNPYSSYQYSLQQSADGGIVLVPRSASDQSSDQSGSNSTTTSRSSGNTGNGSSSNFK